MHQKRFNKPLSTASAKPGIAASFAAFATDGRDGLARLAAGAGLHFVPQVWFLRASPGARGEAVDAGLRVLRFEDLFAARGDASVDGRRVRGSARRGGPAAVVAAG